MTWKERRGKFEKQATSWLMDAHFGPFEFVRTCEGFVFKKIELLELIRAF